MGDQDKGIIRETMSQGHGLAGGQERFGADHRRRSAQLLHDDAVEHTARAAGASIADPGDHHLALLGQEAGLIGREAVGYGRLTNVEVTGQFLLGQ